MTNFCKYSQKPDESKAECLSADKYKKNRKCWMGGALKKIHCKQEMFF